jgi:S-adenosylmethionine hydrolase
MRAPILTLTTDFGLTDHYVGVMKGVILGICPRRGSWTSATA